MKLLCDAVVKLKEFQISVVISNFVMKALISQCQHCAYAGKKIDMELNLFWSVYYWKGLYHMMSYLRV